MIYHDELIGVSDGSFDPETKKASYSWMITTIDNKHRIIKHSQKIPETVDPYADRAEAEEVRCMISTLTRGRKFNGSFRTICDNKAVVNKFKTTDIIPRESSQPHMEIINDICREAKKIADFINEWIKSHQPPIVVPIIK